MEYLKSVWARTDIRQRLFVAFSVLILAVTIWVITSFLSRPQMSLLYAGLEKSAAAEVVESLQQRGVEYTVSGNSIYVPQQERDALRLSLAGEGLPDNGTQGYELLDGLTGFGTTSQMFDAAYWRAKEGELARTVLANPQVAAARVHIANVTSGYYNSQTPPSASVSVTPRGAPLSVAQANSIRFLVASAVSGLAPENVTVVDSAGQILSQDGFETAASLADGRAQSMREKILRLLEARVGPGNAVVEVSLETVTEKESIVERQFDPQSRVAISSDIEERADNSNAGGDEVSVASNLPDGDEQNTAGKRSQSSTSRERINYEVSELQREILKEPGSIRRITVAVLVNGSTEVAEDGTVTYTDRTPEELDALGELVSAAVGVSAERGDIVTIKSMGFLATTPTGTPATGLTGSNSASEAMSLGVVGAAVAAVLALVMGALLFLRRPKSDLSSVPVLSDVPVEGAESMEFLDAPTDAVPDLDLPLNISSVEDVDVDGMLPAMDLDVQMDPLDQLQDIIRDRETETVEILRNWLEPEKEGA